MQNALNGVFSGAGHVARLSGANHHVGGEAFQRRRARVVQGSDGGQVVRRRHSARRRRRPRVDGVGVSAAPWWRGRVGEGHNRRGSPVFAAGRGEGPDAQKRTTMISFITVVRSVGCWVV
jgi:hypothetical protein